MRVRRCDRWHERGPSFRQAMCLCGQTLKFTSDVMRAIANVRKYNACTALLRELTFLVGLARRRGSVSRQPECAWGFVRHKVRRDFLLDGIAQTTHS
jgi:hypothetical protein